MDRYGFAHLLAERVGLSRPLRPFCHWIHGWTWWDDVLKPEDLLGPRALPHGTPVIVASGPHKEMLEREGYRHVHAGGTPFAYVPTQGVRRREGTILAYIAHSAEVERMNVLDLNYLDYLSSLTGRFSVWVSVFSLDESEALKNEITRRGLVPVAGANPQDRNSMIRTRRILELVEHVSTNTFGSHIAYALAAGCRVSVFSPTYQYDVSQYLHPGNGFAPSYAERLRLVHSEPYLRENFPMLFAENVTDGYADTELGLEYIGAAQILPAEQLRKVLGWTVERQIAGYSRGAVRRMRRFVKAFFIPHRMQSP